ncbi:GntR family transcriptional regulator [Alkalicella caledoniensis]|uniref:GntR family transcriptional regulator n=1 Tax=Alkalicella caledoniensis TaxID=2731377 RepID=A0A7G9WAX0_ALKCA|nr:GntR family transcriptional regulator [Alkalicella caledoniensis]QNO15832.1 GntR family transcriptional regulator [Alkalicella caledoniensis]
MTWDLQSDRPIYTQLIEQIELKICSGGYPLGSKLPSVRDLAKEASVNPNTMQRALAKLEEDGLLYSNRTSGRFVTEDKSMVKKIKTKMAQDHIQHFLSKMSELGFEHEEVLEILSTMSKEGE